MVPWRPNGDGDRAKHAGRGCFGHTPPSLSMTFASKMSRKVMGGVANVHVEKCSVEKKMVEKRRICLTQNVYLSPFRARFCALWDCFVIAVSVALSCS
jgi:hypothetical protein